MNCCDLELYMSTEDAVGHHGLQAAAVRAATPLVLPPWAVLRLSCPLTPWDGFQKRQILEALK